MYGAAKPEPGRISRKKNGRRKGEGATEVKARK